MRKIYIVLLLALPLLLVSCNDIITFGPSNVFTGKYVHNLGGKATDFYLELADNGSGHIMRTDGSGNVIIDKDITYSYEYTYFSFTKCEGVLSIEGYRDFLFTWDNNKNYYNVVLTIRERNENGTYSSYTLVPGVLEK